MISLSMTLIDPVFKVTAYLKSTISKVDYLSALSYGQSCYRTLIGNHT